MSYPLKGNCYKRSLFTCSGECSEFVDDTVSLGNWHVFQQHAASTHTSQLVQNWLSHKVDMFWSKEFWPPNSLKLNILDFCEWSTVEIVTNKSRLPNFASLEATNEAAFVDMNCNILIRWRPGWKKVQQCIPMSHNITVSTEAMQILLAFPTWSGGSRPSNEPHDYKR